MRRRGGGEAQASMSAWNFRKLGNPIVPFIAHLGHLVCLLGERVGRYRREPQVRRISRPSSAKVSIVDYAEAKGNWLLE